MQSRSEPPWDDLDPKIRALVYVLWIAGLNPSQSCQGESCDHLYRFPTVILFTDRNEVMLTDLYHRTVEALLAAGVRNFFVSSRIQYDDSGGRSNHAVVVEWFGRTDDPKHPANRAYERSRMTNEEKLAEKLARRAKENG